MSNPVDSPQRVADIQERLATRGIRPLPFSINAPDDIAYLLAELASTRSERAEAREDRNDAQDALYVEWRRAMEATSALAEERETRKMLDEELAKVSALLASHSETSHSTCSAHLADVLAEVSRLGSALAAATEATAKLREHGHSYLAAKRTVLDEHHAAAERGELRAMGDMPSWSQYSDAKGRIWCALETFCAVLAPGAVEETKATNDQGSTENDQQQAPPTRGIAR